MRTKFAGRVLMTVALMSLLAVMPAQAAVITIFENSGIEASVASYIVFDDGQAPVIVGDSHDAGGQFDSSNPAPAVWSESVHSQAVAVAGDLFHSTNGSASLDRTWVTPSLLTINGQASASWDGNVPTSSPGPRGYSTGFVNSHVMLLFALTDATQLTLDYSLTCCYSEFTLYAGDQPYFDSILINAYALQSIPPSVTTGTFSRLLQPDRYLLVASTGSGLSSDYTTVPGSSGSWFDLRLSFDRGSSEVPEPGTTGLLAIGFIGLLLGRRSGRRRPVSDESGERGAGCQRRGRCPAPG